MKHHLRLSAAVALATAGILGLAACGSSSDPLSTDSSSSGTSAAGGGDIVVGSANFSESVLLAEIYAGALRAKGVNATTKPNIGAREIYLRAIEDNSVQVLPEYTGALALYYDKTFDKTDPTEVYDALKGLIPSDLEVLDKSAAEDNDSIVVTQQTADSKNLASIGDLKGVAGDMTLAAPPEFQSRPQGVPGLKRVYGVSFKRFKALTGQTLVQALKNGQVDAANIFSTDPAIAANNFVVLEDTKKLFGSQNIVPLVRKDVADQVSGALNAVSAALTTDKLSALLQQTDVEKKDPKDVAQQFLVDNNLG